MDWLIFFVVINVLLLSSIFLNLRPIGPGKGPKWLEAPTEEKFISLTNGRFVLLILALITIGFFLYQSRNHP